MDEHGSSSPSRRLSGGLRPGVVPLQLVGLSESVQREILEGIAGLDGDEQREILEAIQVQRDADDTSETNSADDTSDQASLELISELEAARLQEEEDEEYCRELAKQMEEELQEARSRSGSSSSIGSGSGSGSGSGLPRPKKKEAASSKRTVLLKFLKSKERTARKPRSPKFSSASQDSEVAPLLAAAPPPQHADQSALTLPGTQPQAVPGHLSPDRSQAAKQPDPELRV